ncbi:MAG: hypothetical protein U0232_04920 [Thermomicrobiales bacterium]
MKAMAALDRYQHPVSPGGSSASPRTSPRTSAAANAPPPSKTPRRCPISATARRAIARGRGRSPARPWRWPEDQRITLELQLAGCSGREIADALDRSPGPCMLRPRLHPAARPAARPFPRPNGRTAAQEESR